MPNRAYRLLRLGLLCGALLLLLLGITAARLTRDFLEANRWVGHSTQVMAQVRSTRLLLGSAATARPHDGVGKKIEAVRQQLDVVADLTRDNPHQQRNVEDLRAQVTRMSSAPGAIFAPGVMDAANGTLDRMQREEYGLLLARSANAASAMRNAGIAILALCGSMGLIGVLTTLVARREYHRRERVEAILQREKQELTRFTKELALVASGSELIQGVEDEAQLSRAVAEVIKELLPESNGYFGLIHPHLEDRVEISERWGNVTGDPSLPCSSCVALQTGRLVHDSAAATPVNCSHVRPEGGDSLCVPIRSGSVDLGVIRVWTAVQLPRRCADSISLLAAHIAVGLTNLRVREDLRRQSTRDSLTGLFNRRYFDDTLERELAASRRGQTPVSVLLIDLDHFKRTNDTFGHAAGDDTLRVLAGTMSKCFRESDVLCRYGGEEFAVILRDADLGDAYLKAEWLRLQVQQAEVAVNASKFGGLTASIGVACSRDCGSAAALVHAADTALYQAKHSGRNKTCVCSSRQFGLPGGALYPLPPSTGRDGQPSIQPAFTAGRAE